MLSVALELHYRTNQRVDALVGFFVVIEFIIIAGVSVQWILVSQAVGPRLWW